MTNTSAEFDENSPIEVAASEWLPRLDRGLTPEEQDRYTEWLAEDAAHREAIGRYLTEWDDFDRLAGIHLKRHARVDTDLLIPEDPPSRKGRTLLQNVVSFTALPFAALIAVVFYFAMPGREEASGGESLEKGVLVHHRSPSGVDQAGRWLHQA